LELIPKQGRSNKVRLDPVRNPLRRHPQLLATVLRIIHRVMARFSARSRSVFNENAVLPKYDASKGCPQYL
jgi:hypothetical protein